MGLSLTKISEDASTITLAWTPPIGVGGYVFYANGVPVSVATANLKNGSARQTVKFSKSNPGPPYEVAATVRSGNILALEVGKYPVPPPLPPNVARSAPTGTVT